MAEPQPKQYRESTKAILAAAKALAAEKRAQGWTPADFAAELKLMLHSDTAVTTDDLSRLDAGELERTLNTLKNFLRAEQQDANGEITASMKAIGRQITATRAELVVKRLPVGSTAAAVARTWRDAKFNVHADTNPGRDAAQRWECEVYDGGEEHPLPRGLGYVCGFGANAELAVLDAARVLVTEKPA